MNPSAPTNLGINVNWIDNRMAEFDATQSQSQLEVSGILINKYWSSAHTPCFPSRHLTASLFSLQVTIAASVMRYAKYYGASAVQVSI